MADSRNTTRAPADDWNGIVDELLLATIAVADARRALDDWNGISGELLAISIAYMKAERRLEEAKLEAGR